MSVLGVNLQKNQIRLVLLAGSQAVPSLLENKKLTNKSASNLSELMDWYRDSFQTEIQRMQPEIVAYRLSLLASPKMEQLENLYYPYGVLNCVCHDCNVEVLSLSSRKLKNPKTIGYPKDTDLLSACEDKLGILSPNDKPQKEAALTAWFSLR